MHHNSNLAKWRLYIYRQGALTGMRWWWLDRFEEVSFRNHDLPPATVLSTETKLLTNLLHGSANPHCYNISSLKLGQCKLAHLSSKIAPNSHALPLEGLYKRASSAVALKVPTDFFIYSSNSSCSQILHTTTCSHLFHPTGSLICAWCINIRKKRVINLLAVQYTNRSPIVPGNNDRTDSTIGSVQIQEPTYMTPTTSYWIWGPCTPISPSSWSSPSFVLMIPPSYESRTHHNSFSTYSIGSWSHISTHSVGNRFHQQHGL